MIGLRHVAWLFLLAPACFHPSYDHPACGPNGECPSGLTCGARLVCEGVSGEPVDAGLDGPVTGVDAPQCFGTGLLHICLAALPTSPLTISNVTTINTDNSPMCTAIVSGGSSYCVVAATTITIGATLRATGARPLVLLASNSITATALIDVGSHRGASPEIGAGADSVVCTAGTLPTSGGGGAGGSFLGLGGTGGTGGASGAGGTSGNTTVITALRGGCSGQDGAGTNPGARGHGGGAVYLIAGNKIDVKGGINAAGEGGSGGVTNLSGGGGGGAGGMIGFDAPTIIASGLILANGGGGGEGSGTATTGASGSDPSAITAASGGSGNVAKGGDGGNGSAGPPAGPGLAGAIGVVDGGGGGGGGGGAGLVKAPAGANLGTQVSPAPTP